MPLHPCNSLINIFSFVSEIHLSRRKSEMTAKGGGKAGTKFAQSYKAIIYFIHANKAFIKFIESVLSLIERVRSKSLSVLNF